MKFSKDELLEILDSYYVEPNDIISDKIIGTRRWSIVHEFIFKKNEKFYRTTYSTGATENQDEQPWDYMSEVECVEVEPYEKTVVEYREVKYEA